MLPSYRLQQLFNITSGILNGLKSHPEQERGYVTQIFLCEHCGGAGFFQNKHEECRVPCEVCSGKGRIKLKFSVQLVPLEV